MVNVALMKTRMEETLWKHEEVVSFAVNSYLLGSGIKRWIFFLDKHLPLHFQANVYKARNGRIRFWVEPVNFPHTYWHEQSDIPSTEYELTASEFLGSQLEKLFDELLQTMKRRLSLNIKPLPQTETLPQYNDVLNYILQELPDLAESTPEEDRKYAEQLLELAGFIMEEPKEV